MSSHNLQGAYVAALHKIGVMRVPRDAKRYTPICQRSLGDTQTQGVKDAAKALSALWKTKGVR